MRGIKFYKSMTERLISSINESEVVKESETNFGDARIKTIKKDLNKLRDRLSKPKTQLKRLLGEVHHFSFLICYPCTLL